MKTYRTAQQLEARIETALARKAGPQNTPLDEVAEILGDGRHYSWIGIYLVAGEISKPGSFPLTASTTIMDAIAIAGGFRDFAKKTGVYILRKGPDGRETRLNFNYKSFIKGKNPEQNIRIEPNDTIIVP